MKTKPTFDGEIHAVSAKKMPGLNSPKRDPGWFLGEPGTTNAPAPAPSGSGVRETPLEWAEIEYDRGDGQTDTCGEWEAPSIVGVYAVNISTCGDMHAPWEVFGGDAGKIGNFPTLDEAKAAAQADYEARILSALASDASPRGEAVACPSCKGEGCEADYAGDDMRCVAVACSSCGGTGTAHPAPATVESAVSIGMAEFRRLKKHCYPDEKRVQLALLAALAPATEGRKG